MFAFAFADADVVDVAWVERLYKSHGHLVLRRARTMLGNDADAHDAVQQIFARLLAHPGAFEGRSKPSTFLYAVTTNFCLTALRDRGNRQRILDDSFAPEQKRSEAPPDDDRVLVRRLLSKVDRSLAEVAIYTYFDEMRQDDIAALLGTSRRHVANLLEQFQAAARALLEVER